MIFTSNLSWQEFAIGVVAAAVGAVGDAIVKSEGLAKFRPRARWILLIFWEPWYVLKGTWLVFSELVRPLGGKRLRGKSHAVPFQYGGQDDASAARRAILAAYVTVSPDSIVVGLDPEKHLVLLHQLGTDEIPELARRLGVES